MAVSTTGDIFVEESHPAAPQAANNSTAAVQSKIRRRNRMITSCLECRRRKLKCDKSQPCANCTKFSRDCVFLAPALDSLSQQKLNDIKDKMGTLERVLEHDVAGKKVAAKRMGRRISGELPGQNSSDSENDAPVPDDEKDLEPTPLAVVDAAYEDDANDDMLDLGVRIGKMRMTERLGGFFRPKMTEELAFTLADPTNDRRTAQEKMMSMPLSPSNAEAFLEPGPTYIAPGSGFVFGDVGQKHALIDFLPSKTAADSLIDRYRRNVHYVARVVHWPSFQVQYDNFWTNVLMGIEPTASLQAIVFAVMFSAVASMTELEITASFSRPKKQVLTNFHTGVEVALGKAHFLRTTKIETVQALVIYLIPMCRAEISRAHSVLVGTAIRLGECMGLHRDPGDVYGLPPVECHVRRLIWAQLCFLDIRTCESQGPRPNIRREDYDTRFPLNINDADLLDVDPKETDGQWTDMSFSRMRFESNEMHRVVWQDRMRLEKKQISITHVLGKIESFRAAMMSKYNPIMDDNVPIQRAARHLLDLLLLRMHIMVLHRYHNSVTVRIPDRLRQIILTSGTKSMEAAIKLETIPELAPWRWYCGAYNQWQTAFLLLVEIYTYPMRKEADRIWDIIDYVFEPDRSLSRSMKGRILLSELRDKTAIYRDIRKVRAPVSMLKRLAQNQKPHARRIKDSDTISPSPLGRQNSTSQAQNVNVNTTEQAPQLDKGTSDQSYQSPALSPQAANDPSNNTDWSFDTAATLLFNPPYARKNSRGEKNKSAVPGVGIKQKTDYASPQYHSDSAMGGSPSVPSEISTTDSWPPFIFQSQSSWQLPQQTAQQQQQQQQCQSQPQPQLQPQSQRPFAGNLVSPIPAQTSGSAAHLDLASTQHPNFPRQGYAINSPGSKSESEARPGIALAIPDGEAGMTGLASRGNGKGMPMQPDDAMMLDIDWGEWDKIFPPEVNTGVLNMPSSRVGDVIAMNDQI